MPTSHSNLRLFRVGTTAVHFTVLAYDEEDARACVREAEPVEPGLEFKAEYTEYVDELPMERGVRSGCFE
jgi:hypothetical protein